MLTLEGMGWAVLEAPAWSPVGATMPRPSWCQMLQTQPLSWAPQQYGTLWLEPLQERFNPEGKGAALGGSWAGAAAPSQW